MLISEKTKNPTRMKRILLLMVMAFSCLFATAQFDGIVVEEVDNGGAVPGKTYRIYVKVKNAGDGVDIIFGAPTLPMTIESTKPFYQNEKGGFTSKDVIEEELSSDKKLQYDSFVTINRLSNKDNDMAVYTGQDGIEDFDYTEFESKGGSLFTENGSWHCVPNYPQTKSGDDKRILIMQLTTKGTITGTINLQGKYYDADGNVLNWRKDQVTFSCGE